MKDWLIHIKRGEYSSLQTQIREALVSAILDRQLDREEPIPSTRKMAKSLGVSRNTVVLAYQGMLDDGYLLAKQRSGYFVADKALDDHVPRKLGKAQAEKPKAPGLNWDKLVKSHPSQQKNVVKAKAAPEGAGDVWTWTALDADTKLIVSYYVADRTTESALRFMAA